MLHITAEFFPQPPLHLRSRKALGVVRRRGESRPRLPERCKNWLRSREQVGRNRTMEGTALA